MSMNYPLNHSESLLVPSLDEFQNYSQILINPVKKNSVSSGHGHVTSKKSLQSNNKSGIYDFVFLIHLKFANLDVA